MDIKIFRIIVTHTHASSRIAEFTEENFRLKSAALDRSAKPAFQE